MNLQDRPDHLFLLQACLLEDREQAVRAWQAWKRLVRLDDLDHASFRIISLAYVRLRDAGLDDPDLGRIRGIYRYQWTKNQIAFRGKADLLRAFAAASIPTLLLKGAALCRTVYADPTARPMHDLDLLVPAADAARVVALLQDRGWEAQHFAPQAIIDFLHACSFVHPRAGELDLHWHAMRSRCRDDLDAGLWAASLPHEFDGAPVRVLCLPDQFLHTCEHSLHDSPSSSLQWMVDACLILRRAGPGFDWDRLEDQAGRFRLVLPVRQALTLLQRHFQVDVPGGVLRRLARGPVDWTDRVEHFLARRPPAARRAALHQAGEVFIHYRRLRRGHPVVPSLLRFSSYLRFLNHYERNFGWFFWEGLLGLALRPWARMVDAGLRVRAALDGHPAPLGLDWDALQRADPRGFYKQESSSGQTFRWSLPRGASLTLPLPEAGCILIWEFPSFTNRGELWARHPVWRLDGRRLHPVRLALPLPSVALWLPARATRPGAPRVLEWTADALTPGGRDGRALGLPLHRLRLLARPT